LNFLISIKAHLLDMADDDPRQCDTKGTGGMGYKTISIVISDKESDLHAMNAAIALTQREAGHLDVYCLGVDPVRFDAAPIAMMSALPVSTSDDVRVAAKDLVAWAEEKTRAALFPVTVQALMVESAGLDAAISRIVRYSDLIIASQPYGPGSTEMQVSVLEAELFGTGAPVLVVPRTERDYGHAFDRLMVAWNESAQSLEAVRKAMPALADADRAEIVMVDPPPHSPERSDPGGAICIMLARHGVKTDVSVLAKTMPRVSEVLNRHAQDHSNDLIIMGAYGHSRMREALLGGATRDMLETAQVPVMMAH